MNKLHAELNHIFFDFSNDGKYRFTLPGFTFEDCISRLMIDGRNEVLDWQLISNTSTGIIFETTTEHGCWNLDFLPAGNDGFSICFYGKLNAPHKDIRLTLLTLPELAATHLLTQWIGMGHCKSIRLPAAQEEDFCSFYQTMITNGEHTLQISFPLQISQYGSLSGKIGTEIQNLEIFFETKHYDGLEFFPEPVTFRSSRDGFQLMNEWANTNIDVVKDFSGIAKPGWNSWDYYRWTITEDEVLKNAEFIAGDPILSKHVKRIIVDDGWQYCYGEWDANKFFPHGMEYLAKELTKMGFEPGLWFAPSIVEPHSPIAQLHEEMLARGESGFPCLGYSCMERYGFILDPTVPSVQKHLHDLFARYAKMGYKYFKLDFLNSTLNARQFADRRVPRSKIVNKLLAPIYDAVHGQALILGCNYPFLAGNEYVDAVRIGADIHSTWQGINENVIAAASRFWSNRKLWINDPDFALCRGLDTSNDPAMLSLKPYQVFIRPGDLATPEIIHNAKFNMVDLRRQQLEILLGVVLMAAGAVNLSDNMPRLNKSGLDLARRIVSAPPGEAATPLDLFKSERPSYWLQKAGTKHRVMLVNWEDIPEERGLNLHQYGIEAVEGRNFWNDETVHVSDEILTARLPARSCLLVEF